MARVAKQQYARRKATLIRQWCGEPCRTFHPECFQCQTWAMTPAQRWQETKDGIAEYQNEETAWERGG